MRVKVRQPHVRKCHAHRASKVPAHISSPTLPRADGSRAGEPVEHHAHSGRAAPRWPAPGGSSREGTTGWMEEQRVAENPPAQWARAKVSFPRTQARAQPPAHQPRLVSQYTQPAEGEMTQQRSTHNCPRWGRCTAWELGGASRPIWSCGSHAGLPGEPPARSPPPQPTSTLGFEVGGVMREFIN